MSAEKFNLETVDQVRDTSSETKNMTGFRDVAAVAAAAPERPGQSDIAQPVRASATARGGKKASLEAQKKAEKDARVEKALEQVGLPMMRELASLPYEAWSYFFADPALALTEKEAETLANTYFGVLQALRPEELASWKILLAFAGLQNMRLVISKYREHNKRVEEAKKAAEETGLPEVSVM